MKKVLILFIGMLMALNHVYAGGIVTNTNHSAAYSRMLSRDASIEIDAVYYNPAGLTKLSDGFHVSISSQTIGQKQTVYNSLLDKEFEGKVSAPVFPAVYGAYRTGKWAFSLGFNPIGGGGGAKFAEGLPLIELGISALPAQFTSLGSSGAYSYQASFEGASIYFGFQGGVSYAINDMISVYAGGRYVTAKNTYKGEITNVELASNNPGMPVLSNETLTSAANANTEAASNLEAAFEADQLQPVYRITDATDPTGAITAGLTALGYDQTQIDNMTMAQAQMIFSETATSLNTAAGYLADQFVDAEQTGSGFTPILGVNISLMEERLNFGFKYEFIFFV
jgi:long-subunit fatty acid transport protein